MRIGILTYDFSPPIGGLGIVAQQTKQMLETLFPEDTLIALSPSENADDRVSSLAASRWKKSGGCPLFSLMLLFRLPSLIIKHRLDLLHVHAGSGGVFLLRKPSCPLVVTAHHTYLQEAEIVFSGSLFKCLWKKFMSKLEKRTYALADRIVCVSKDTADFLVQRYDIPKSKVCVIENAVTAASNNSLQRRDPATILFIGRLEERKGIWTLLKAIEILRVSHPSIRVRLIGRNLIGDALEKFLFEKNLTHVVTLLGHTDDASMYRELAATTVLVVPSLLEGFGLIAAQGMLAGTCVIVSDAPGLRSIVRDHETGLVCTAGDRTDCARAIVEALGSPELRQKLSEKGREDARKRFSPEERAKDLHAVFETVLTPSPSPSAGEG